MTGINENNKFIPKTPETYEVRFVENQEQQNQQEQSQQKSTTEKVVEAVANVPSTVKETVVPSVHASDSKEDKGSSNDGRGSPKIVQADNSWVKSAMEAQGDLDKRKAMEDAQDAPCDIQ